MQTYWLNFPEIETRLCGRPKSCPHCRSQLLQGWGRSKKTVQDGGSLEAEVRRFRCCDCGRTFRRYPQGVARGTRSQRLRSLAAVVWALGLSLDDSLAMFGRLGLQVSRTSLWRDAREQAGALRLERPDEGFYLSDWTDIDGEYSPGFRREAETTLILDLGCQGRVALGVSHLNGQRAFSQWLSDLTETLEIELTPV